ncbi:MAG: outer membrane lipoprotein-sorting protein, partial [Candidatus Atribacteria bacterium]|nr:outer membrane lipoprotein-sorting protein [Candidatus Atribacteria bacterium]
SVDDSQNTKNKAFLFRFLSPAEVQNVTMLSVSDGEQIYLYMPAFKKVRRIAGSSKKEKFAGTNFSFGDFGGGYTKNDYESKLLNEDDTNYIIELKPKDKDSEYSRLTMTIDKAKLYFKKIEFTDLDGNPAKVLDVQEVKEETDGTITIMKMTFMDLKENTRSFMQMEKVEKGLTLPEGFFSVRTIQRPEI